ncbi:MAG: hypothetical protein JWO90_2580 [Solirubrobacterales bacterium]|nr:hypothetical protein [Solirubrobacterales bacterium]
MSSLEPRSGKRVTRKEREAKALRLVAVGGTAGAVAVIGFVLAAIGVVGFGVPLLAGILAVICLVLFRRNVGM